jgi:hypothetical protein
MVSSADQLSGGINMYMDRVLLPPVSNREDLVMTVSVFDDDTGAAVNLAGITLAPANVNGYTGSSWLVTCGAVNSVSSSTLTIPGYPIGNQLQSVSLTISTGLSIAAGSPVTIVDNVTGQNGMAGYVTSYNSATGALVCRIGMSVQFEIRGADGSPQSGYAPYYDFGVQSDAGPLLSASLGNGISISDLGYIAVNIPESQIRQLAAANSYRVGMTITDGVNTRQLMIAQLPVLWGGVTN